MKEGRRKFRHLYDRLLGMRLCYQMVLLYIIGGALPVILIGMYLIQGTSQILMEREMQAELSELDRIGREADSLFSTVNSLSTSFYFDEKLEHISEHPYQEYQELVNDYRDYTAFNTMRNLYSRLLHYITIYMENDTIVENAHFQKVDEQLCAKEWYQQVVGRGGGAVWQYLPFHLDQKYYLALTRLLRTKKAGNVGVLVIYLRPERLEEILGIKREDVCVVLNQEELLIGGEGQPWRENIRDILKEVNGQNRRSICVFLGSVVLSVTMIWLFSRAFSGRVKRFHRQMQKAASGDFDLEKNLGGNDEISELYGYLWSMIVDIQRLLAEIYQERLHAEQLYARQKEAEFKMLASQMNPHFLYNTLETIWMKAKVNHQTEIEELVKMLAKILRNNVRAGNRDVTLGQELDLVESYLKIQQYRFDERLEYMIAVEEGLEEEEVLPLILQPIVENSIIHGLESN